jgi:hypothetical protein
MPGERAPGPWWEPTWRRLIGSTFVLFLVILAFLVGRVRSGADPALAGGTARRAQQAPALGNGGGADPQGQGVDPSQVDPSTGGGSDDFGNAIPDDGSGSDQSIDPPSTHVS